MGRRPTAQRPEVLYAGAVWRRLGQAAAHGAVAQRVVDELDQFASRGDDADVAAAALGDSVAVGADTGVPAGALHRLDRGPAHEVAALFGAPAAVHGCVGLVTLRGQPGLAGQLRRPGKAVHVADLHDEHRPEDRADAGSVCTAA